MRERENDYMTESVRKNERERESMNESVRKNEIENEREREREREREKGGDAMTSIDQLIFLAEIFRI